MEENYLTSQQLAYFNGEYDSLSYIAVHGVIYDVSESMLWKFGRHQIKHIAGKDLTDELKDAPHGEDILNRFRVVGFLLDED